MAELTDIPIEECLALLHNEVVGRVAIDAPTGVSIVPVNYSVYDGDIVFRTAPYSQLGTYGWHCRLAFEIDGADVATHQGWSVVVKGRAELVDDPKWLASIRQQNDPRPWANGQRWLYIRLHPEEVTGRRIRGGVPEQRTGG
ncbi:pyridoxamine 5'-phosphate oxidase family protein [Nocardioides pakistanensis]